MREFIQVTLNGLENIEVSTEVPDDMLVSGKTYFSFTVSNNYENSDFDKNYTYRPVMVGYVKRLNDKSENTLEIVDDATLDIVSKLKEINIRCSFNDVSVSDNIRKIRITGECVYNEINNEIL